jgi:hypothetical protein
VAWYKIQPRLLNDAEADVLLIFDCCYAASAARAYSKVRNRVELLAAAPIKYQTPPPGPHSFTSKMIREMKTLLSAKRAVVIAELHNHLTKQQSGLFETAVFVELQPGSGRRIKLEKLGTRLPTRTPPASSLTLRVSTRKRLDEDVFRDIINWMENLSPRVISELAVEEVYHTTEKLREFVQEEPTESIPHPMFQQLPENARQEALDLCQELDVVLEGGAALSRLPSTFAPETSKDYEDMARKFVNELGNKVIVLRKSLERNIVARCGERDSLIEALNDKMVQSLGITDTLRMKGILLDPVVTGESMEVESQELGLHDSPGNMNPRFAQKELDRLGRVFVEYKYYNPSENSSAARRMASERVMKLAKVLGEPKSENFQTLHCFRWFHEPDHCRFGLVFEIPKSLHSTLVTLQDVMNPERRTKFRPTLEQRFDMAWKIGQAVQKWHLAGWVHQGISSRNIFFSSDSEIIDYSRPYLCGFEYSRPSAEKSYPRSEDIERDVYQHPDRQGTLNIQFQRVHDLYAFGVLLMEIGLWQPALRLFEKKTGITAEKMKRELVGHCETRLAYFMGTNYQSAALTCLYGGFGIDVDDSAHSRLSKAFDTLVLQNINCGKHLG